MPRRVPSVAHSSFSISKAKRSANAMAPMLLTVAREFELAPHAVKAEVLAEPEPVAEPVVTRQCQICFDDVVEDAENTPVVAFCSKKCPAVLCRSCVAEHVRVAVGEAFPGVLPKVRCPICLVPMNKSKWESFVSEEVLAKYKDACRSACSFQSPCCHDTSYSHLPYVFDATDLPSKYIKPSTLYLVPSLKKKYEPLRDRTRRFCNHKLTSRELIGYIEDTFGRHVPIETQHLIVEHVLARIFDEERRATLLLSYHAKYKSVKTRCCGYAVCFNCKRLMSNHVENDGACEQDAIDESCIVECRSCHVTMVKVEGCSSVRCWCGFTMDWEAELSLRNRYKKKLVPVDVFDIELCSRWLSWERELSRSLRDEMIPIRKAMLLSRIDYQLSTIPSLRKPLLSMLQQYIWRLRYTRSLPQLVVEINLARMTLLAARLKKMPLFVAAVQRSKWRSHWAEVVKAVRNKQFWLAYHSEHREEQRELKQDEMAMLLPRF